MVLVRSSGVVQVVLASRGRRRSWAQDADERRRAGGGAERPAVPARGCCLRRENLRSVTSAKLDSAALAPPTH